MVKTITFLIVISSSAENSGTSIGKLIVATHFNRITPEIDTKNQKWVQLEFFSEILNILFSITFYIYFKYFKHDLDKSLQTCQNSKFLEFWTVSLSESSKSYLLKGKDYHNFQNYDCQQIVSILNLS